MDIADIQQRIRAGEYEFSIHAQQERLEEDLDATDIEEAIAFGEILEEYPNDPRGESCLLLGHAQGRPIHAVVGWATRRGMAEKALRIITVYIPRPPKWSNPRTRGGRP
jgi:hypothetical protein